MKTQKFGIEIEMTGLTRAEGAEVIAKYFGTTSEYAGLGYDAYTVKDDKHRTWKVMRDASIRCFTRTGSTSDGTYSVELVSPICSYDDIETIQQIVRNLREAGAKVNDSCGIHIHVNGAPFDATTLRNLTNIMNSKENLIYKALQVSVSRERSYCKKVDQSFLEELNRRKPKTLDKIQDIWYKGNDGSNMHYHDSRYHCLNLHSLFSKGTIEFRLFNSTLHAGKIKAYIQFCLAITHQALTQKCASRRVTESTNEKYTFRTWLLRLGMIGEEFKTARTHLLSHLDGCIAWKNPEQAELQKERLKAKRENRSESGATEQGDESAEASTEDTENSFTISM